MVAAFTADWVVTPGVFRPERVGVLGPLALAPRCSEVASTSTRVPKTSVFGVGAEDIANGMVKGGAGDRPVTRVALLMRAELGDTAFWEAALLRRREGTVARVVPWGKATVESLRLLAAFFLAACRRGIDASDVEVKAAGV